MPADKFPKTNLTVMLDTYKAAHEAQYRLGIYADWRAGMSYDDLHRKYMCPALNSEAECCVRARGLKEQLK